MKETGLTGQRKVKKNSVKKNYIFNLSYEIFLLVIPIFVTPYVSRVLGVDGSGQYSYTFSIVTYFTLFAALGFSKYAQRLVASHQGDREQQSVDFWEVFYARLIPVSLTLAVYLILAVFGIYGEKHTALMWVLSINVIAVAFDIVFFFQGNEEFGKIVIRNFIIRCLSIAAIFAFVKDSDDLILYTFIQVASTFLSNASLWLYMPKYLVKVKTKINPIKHIGPTLVLFLPTIATSVYTSLDKTMIGLITGLDSENGNYEYAEKLVKMAMTAITSLGTVMIPRNSQNFAQGNMEAVKHNIYHSCKFVMLLGIPMMMGIIAVADNMIPWYLGDGYDKAATLMKVLSPILVIIGLSNVFGLQFLIPCRMDKKYTIAIVSGAVTNFCLNALMIRMWGSYGAAFATVAAETVVTIVMFRFIREYIDFKEVMRDSWRYILAGVIMFLAVVLTFGGWSASFAHTAIMIASGAAVYFAVLIIMKEEFTWMGIAMVKKCILRVFGK